MKSVPVFFFAALFLGVTALPSRLRRQFDWDRFENIDALNTDNEPSIRISRQGPQSWENQRGRWNEMQMGRQMPFNNIDSNFDMITDNNGQGLNANQGVDNGVSSTTTTDVSTTTRAPASYTTCMSACLRTSEYNPVCGTDGRDYTNRHELRCAASCGRVVQLRRGGTCNPL